MRKNTIMLMVLLLISFSVFSAGQVEPVWKKSFASKVNWQKVTSYGNLIVGTQSALYGINPEDGSIAWEKANFPGLPETSFQEIEGVPFFSLQMPDRIVMLDMFMGNEVFDSKKAGIAELISSDFLYLSGGILISGKPAGAKEPILLMVDMASGNVKWKIEEATGKVIAVNELNEEEVLVVTLFNNFKIKSADGTIIWKKATSKEAEAMSPAATKLLSAFAETLTGGKLDIDLTFFQDEERDMFIIGSTNENQSSMSTTSTTVSYSSNYSAYKISDGSLIWNEPIELNGKVSQLIFEQDGIIILPDNGNNTKINLYDYTTTQGKWGKKGKGFNIKGGIYDYHYTDKGILLTSANSGNNFLSLLDPALGILKFDKPVKISGEVVRVVSVAGKLLYITTEEMNILDPASGVLVLPKSLNTRPQLTIEDDQKVYAFDLKTNEVMAVNKSDASLTAISKAPIKFQGKEDPASIEIIDEGILLTSEQNIALIDKTGSIAFQNYYPAPKEPALKKALLYAQAVRAAYYGAYAYYASAALHDAAAKTDNVVGKELAQGLGTVYGQIGDAATDFVKESFKQASARYKATVSGRDFMFMMIDTDTRDNALALINKKTGQIESTVNMGKEKTPNYAVDDVTSQIYYQVKDNEIVSYKF